VLLATISWTLGVGWVGLTVASGSTTLTIKA